MHDTEWLKILLSALAGMLAGFIADPIRAAFARDVELYRMRRAITLDLLNVITGQTAVMHGAATAHQFWQWKMFPSFTFYWQRNMEYFYSDFTLHAVRMNIQAIQLLQSSVQSGIKTVADGEAKLEDLMKPLRGTLLETKPRGWEMLKRRIFAKLT
jgi:hypothetical protein